MSPLLKTPNRFVQGTLFLALLAGAGGFGYFHASIGSEISFLLFYLLPVAGATWFVGRTAGIVMAGACGVIALGADLSMGREYSQAWIPVYNALVVTGFFLISAYALAHLRAALQQEARLAREDILTNIPNLRSFREDLPDAFEAATERRSAITVALVDLSDISYINDRWGSSAGDMLLRVTAHTLQKLQRPGDLLGRVGGTTFAVVYPGVGEDQAEDFVGRIRRHLLAEIEGYDRPVTISVAAVCSGRANGSSDRMLDHASSVLGDLKLSGQPHPFRVERETIRT